MDTVICYEASFSFYLLVAIVHSTPSTAKTLRYNGTRPQLPFAEHTRLRVVKYPQREKSGIGFALNGR